jgi:hypothetical protein
VTSKEDGVGYCAGRYCNLGRTSFIGRGPAWMDGFRRLYFVYGGAREVGIAGNVNKLALALYNFKGIQLLSTISLWPMWLGWK